VRKLLRRIPILGSLARRLYRAIVKPAPFRGSADYWRTRYAEGGDSGAGSYAKFAAFKAEVLNDFVREQRIAGVIEFGCGDGNQLSYAAYPSYLGLDISPDAIRICRERFAGDPSKRFQLLEEHGGERADAALSLDVVYHLIEDEVFEDYMTRLFEAADRFVIIYSSDTDDNPTDQDPHVRQRRISRWIAAHRPEWTRIAHIPNRYPYAGDPLTGTFSEFHIFAPPGPAN
jgi:SAM-dependent methyltransferase